jgi:hypothetical protein
MDLNGLRTRYPSSSHEFWAMPSGRIFIPGEDVARFRAFLTGGTGAYILRVSPSEVVEDVFYVQVELETGQARGMTLRFDQPIIWQDDASTLTWDCGEYAIQIRPR